jgi:uncharacterized RDD family membrane protein YckC
LERAEFTPRSASAWLPLWLCALLLIAPNLRAQPASEPSSQNKTTTPVTQAEATDSTITNSTENTSQGLDRGPMVSIGSNVELKSTESADAVVVIFGSGKVRGHVRDAAVSIFGDLDIDSEVGDAAVAVMGNLKLGPHAKIHGEAVAVGGKIDAAETASIDGKAVPITFPDWLQKWFLQCALKLRPLAPQIGWVWWVDGIIFLIYLLIAAAFPRPVEACASELTRRPATTFLLGLLVKILLPLVFLILAATGIGLIVLPFVGAALFLGAMVGKAALFEWLGLKFVRGFSGPAVENRLLALVVGAVIITLLYMVPVVGLLTFGIASLWGLGAAVTAAFGGMRKEMPEKPIAPTPAPAPVTVPAGQGFAAGPAPADPAAPATASAFASGPVTAGASVVAPSLLNPPVAMPEVLTYPKSGFWERMGAAFLDVVLIGILAAFMGPMAPLTPLVALAYFAGMWAWKGSTIGGTVLGLKVVRFDGQPVSFAAAIVRALGAAFSTVVFFLGFVWIIWDKEKQGWHDKIAGTIVLKLPKGTPLVLV